MGCIQIYLYNLATDKYKGFVPGLLKFFLFLLSLIYGFFVKLLVFFCRLNAYSPDCKVISVGNITLGGTGKTTLVEYIATYLKNKGHKIAVISRGYKRKVTGQASQDTSYEAMGDEPFMLMKSLGDVPVIVDADRIRGIRQALDEYKVDTVIFDDGFQQWKIKKDLEIVTIDAANPFGNRQLIPRGILREGLSSLGRADIFVINKAGSNPDIKRLNEELKNLNPRALTITSTHKPLGFYDISKPAESMNLNLLKGKTVTIFSGIGDPDSFEALIKGLGINIGLSFRFNDHHSYTKEDLDMMFKNCRQKNIDTAITTQKDAARLHGLLKENGGIHILILRIGLVVLKNEHEFHNRLLKLYSV